MVKRRNRDIQIFIDNERPRNGKLLSAPFHPNSRIRGHSGPEVCGLQRRSSRPNIRRRSFLVYDCRLLAYLHEMAHSARLAGGVRSPPMRASNVAPSGAGWVEGRPRCRAVLCRRRLTEWPSADSTTCADFLSCAFSLSLYVPSDYINFFLIFFFCPNTPPPLSYFSFYPFY